MAVQGLQPKNLSIAKTKEVMRQQPSGRRPRGRSNRKHFVSPRSQTYDSHGPDVRVRGNAMQVYEKYVNLARDANSSGDRIAAESYQQYAEHYFRILNDTTDPQRPPAPERGAGDRPPGERPAGERPGGERAAGERPGAERPTAESKAPGEQPYPVDAEQPFVEGASAPATAQPNGELPEAAGASKKPAKAAKADGEAAQADGETAPTEGEKAEAKPRPKARPRARTKAKNGSAAESGNGAGGSVKTAPCEPSEASESGA